MHPAPWGHVRVPLGGSRSSSEEPRGQRGRRGNDHVPVQLCRNLPDGGTICQPRGWLENRTINMSPFWRLALKSPVLSLRQAQLLGTADERNTRGIRPMSHRVPQTCPAGHFMKNVDRKLTITTTAMCINEVINGRNRGGN